MRYITFSGHGYLKRNKLTKDMKKKRQPVLVSVMIPIYNAESFLNDAIDSVLSQTFSEFELLALDDGSSDLSKEIVLSYKDTRIKYISCKHNFINTINKGIRLSKGKYIALLDHDDMMMPYRLCTQYSFMEEHHDIAACGGYMHSFGRRSELMKVPEKHDDIIENMLLRSVMLNPTGFIRKSVLLENSIQYKNGYSFAADYKMWLDIAKVGVIENIPKVLTLYRTYDKQTSIVYHNDCIHADLMIKAELLDFFLSHLKKNDKYSKMIDEELLPLINKLGGLNCFSQHTFFSFFYELIKEFRKNGVIVV